MKGGHSLIQMCPNYDKTIEAQLLDAHPDIRDEVGRQREFINWKSSLPSVVIDGERLYVRGGDMLKDEAQIIFEWIRAFRPELLGKTQTPPESKGIDTNR